jgi:hypothetical protein
MWPPDKPAESLTDCLEEWTPRRQSKSQCLPQRLRRSRRSAGIPLGYALTRLLVWLVWQVVDVRLPVVFPPWNILIALVGTVALALLVLFLPVHRAVRFRPGDALRYA